jgi:hypothetical protein
MLFAIALTVGFILFVWLIFVQFKWLNWSIAWAIVAFRGAGHSRHLHCRYESLLGGAAPDRHPDLFVVELALSAALLMTAKFAPSSLVYGTRTNQTERKITNI